MPAGRTQRRRLRVTGTVQGVGFRPFVFRQATALGLEGTVANVGSGVLIEVEGPPDRIDDLCRRLVDHAPALARVEAIQSSVMTPTGGGSGFAIVASSVGAAPTTPVSPDVATCDACLAEIADPADRRYRYPFTNCTDCGPRYTIVAAVPYDRAATTMRGFTMCAACRAEYGDPGDRRYHAQPNACPDCGPQLRWCTPDGRALTDRAPALSVAVTRLVAGDVVAIKGLGGFHLAVDATDPNAVARLRRRKHRDDKPFAVMVADLATAGREGVIDDGAAAALASPARPIVLVERRPGGTVVDAVAPGLPDLGLLLPYTPLHHLLLGGVQRPLVMTSANLSDEPIAHEDDDAFARLRDVVDGVLTHDRTILVRADDSVVRAGPAPFQVLRRSRGYAPGPLTLPRPARRAVLAVGAELKSTVAVVAGDRIVASHHIGDLEHPAAHESFRQAGAHLCRLHGVAPDVVAHDLHPGYLSTAWALDTDLPTWGVQHHHAHVASCLVDHQEVGPVLGLAFDGLGYGCDRTLWGGELLVADLDRAERVGHLRPCSLPGGAAAIREPWRMAVAWTLIALGPDAARREGHRHDHRADDLVGLAASGTAPVTSSVGRLFDAVAALLGVRTRVTYEGQAAIELEALARRVPRSSAPCYPLGDLDDGGLPQLDPGPLVAAVIADRDRGTPVEVVAAGFHDSFGRAAAGLAVELARRRQLERVALTGGVFQNRRLSEVVAGALRDAGLEVLVHRRVPPNDGGISIGQAAVAATGVRVPGS